MATMSDVTHILSAIEQGDPSAAEDLLPLVYNELRKLATAKMAQEKLGQTLQATALVHEAYIRLVDTDRVQQWDSRGHFFAAAAEAMRRILIANARAKGRQKRGGGFKRLDLDSADLACTAAPDEVVALDHAIEKLGDEDPRAAQLVKLRYYAGMSLQQCAKALQVSTATAYRQWNYARAWLHHELSREA